MQRDTDLEATLVAKYVVMGPRLNERTRRLWTAAESIAISFGGDAIVSSATGLARQTIRNGRVELAQGLTATAIDPDGDSVTLRSSAPQGVFSAQTGQNATWTAPNQPGNVPITATAQDRRGGTATSTVTVQVARRKAIMFEDVYFDFDRSAIPRRPGGRPMGPTI